MDLVIHDWNKKTRDRGDKTHWKASTNSSNLRCWNPPPRPWISDVQRWIWNWVVTWQWTGVWKWERAEAREWPQRPRSSIYIKSPILHVKPWCLAKRRQTAPITAAWRSGFGSGFVVWRDTAAALGAVGSGLGSGAVLSAVHRSH